VTEDVRHSCDAEHLVRRFKTRRNFLKLVGLAGAALVAPPWVTACEDSGDPTGPAGEGSSIRGPVEGYASATSYRPGETAAFHLSADATSIDVDVVRVGAMAARVLESRAVPVDQQVVPNNASQLGCAWPVALRLPIPSTWRSGVYFARFWSGPVTNPLWAATIPFVVKAASRASSMLYQVPVTTYQAYNAWGGSSLYTRDAQGYTHPFASFERPYRDLRQFKQWDLPFIRWMEQAGFTADYCTSIDLHNDPALRLSASGYQLLVSVGHDEYWSWEMRDNVEEFIASGGNVAFFGGNTCWWQIRLEADGRRIVCYKDPQQNVGRDPAWGWGGEGRRRVTTNWSSSPVARPEERMTGLSFRYGAAFFNPRKGPPTDVGFRVGPSDHWAFAGASAADGVVGRGTVGYETDGACLRAKPDGSPAVDEHNIPIVCEDAGDGRVPFWPPDSLMVLATTDPLAWPGRTGRATMALYRNNGLVFNAATMHWARGLPLSDQVRVITRNVLRRLTGGAPPSPALVNLSFEAWASNGPDGWYGASPDELTPQLSQETRRDYVREGGASLRVNAQAAPMWLAQDFSVSGGEYYVVSGWIRSNGPLSDNDGHWLTISLEQVGPGAGGKFATARYTATGGQWQHVRAYGRAEVAGPFSARIVVESSLPDDAWFDGLRVDVL